MAVPQNKSELVFAIQKEYQKLANEIEKIPRASVFECTMEGHVKDSMMSPHNLLAYLLGWNELVLKWHAKMGASAKVDFPETGFKWNELGLLAQKFYRDYETLDFDVLVKRLNKAKDKILLLIDRYENEDLYGKPWYEKWTMGRMIQLNSSSPYSNATARLRKWNKLHSAK